MWRRIPWRAFERTGARAPGAAIGWTVVVILMLAIPATRLGLYPGNGAPAEPVEDSATEAVLGPTVTSPSLSTTEDEATDDSLFSIVRPDLSSESDQVGRTDKGSTSLPATTVPTNQSIEDPAADEPSTSTSLDSATSTTTTTATPSTSASTTAAPATTESTTAPTTTATTSPSSTIAPTTTPPSTTTPSPTTTAPTATAPTTTAPTDPNLAVGDTYQVESGKKKKLKVLSNDAARGLLDQSSLEIVGAPSHAEDFRVHGNHIDYESDDDYEGTDSLRYRICTFDGVCDVATVTIQVIDD